LNVLIYGSRIIGNRIRFISGLDEAEIIYYTQKVIRPKDLKSLRSLRGIDLAIVDTTETGAEQVCNYMGKIRKIALALLVGGGKIDWEALRNCPAVAYISKDAEDLVFTSDIKRVISRIRNLNDIYRTEKEVTVKNLRLVME